MADINATDLTPETLATLDGDENVVLFDTAEGKKVTLQDLADYVVQKATESLMGSSQTVAEAFTALNSNLKGIPNPSNGRLKYVTNSDCDLLVNEWVLGKGTHYPIDNFFWYVHSFAYEANSDGTIRTGKQIAYDYMDAETQFERVCDGGVWKNWVKKPARAELDPTIKSFSACGKDWFFIKIGKIVLVSATRDISSASAGSNSIGTLEAGWRPYQDIKLRPQNSTANAWLAIDHNTGEISYYTSSAVSAASNCSISGSYYTP